MKKMILLFFFVSTLSFILSLYAQSKVSDSWILMCLEECTKNNPSHKDCNQNSIAFIGDEYVRARKGESYWPSDGGKTFSFSFQAADHRFSQLKEICPKAADVLKRSVY
jgi:hypothetical protein